MEQEEFEIISEETIDNMLFEIKDAITEIGYDAKFSGDEQLRGYSSKVISHIHKIIIGSKII